MLKLQVFSPKLGIRNASPACLKADALMAMSGLPYELDYADVRKAPRQKFPVLLDNGKPIPDSNHIQTHLSNHHGFDIDKGLSKEQLATAHCVQHMLEDFHYFILIFFRWIEQPEVIRKNLFSDIPNPIRKVVFSIIHRNQKKLLWLQGTSRHSRAELIEFARQNFASIDTLLGDQPYLFGAQLRSIDATVYASLESSFNAEVETPFTDMKPEFPRLLAYCDRFRNEVFGE